LGARTFLPKVRDFPHVAIQVAIVEDMTLLDEADIVFENTLGAPNLRFFAFKFK
jgi:hypothetical protein